MTHTNELKNTNKIVLQTKNKRSDLILNVLYIYQKSIQKNRKKEFFLMLLSTEKQINR